MLLIWLVIDDMTDKFINSAELDNFRQSKALEGIKLMTVFDWSNISWNSVKQVLENLERKSVMEWMYSFSVNPFFLILVRSLI